MPEKGIVSEEDYVYLDYEFVKEKTGIGDEYKKIYEYYKISRKAFGLHQGAYLKEDSRIDNVIEWNKIDLCDIIGWLPKDKWKKIYSYYFDKNDDYKYSSKVDFILRSVVHFYYGGLGEASCLNSICDNTDSEADLGKLLGFYKKMKTDFEEKELEKNSFFDDKINKIFDEKRFCDFLGRYNGCEYYNPLDGQEKRILKNIYKIIFQQECDIRNKKAELKFIKRLLNSQGGVKTGWIDDMVNCMDIDIKIPKNNFIYAFLSAYYGDFLFEKLKKSGQICSLLFEMITFSDLLCENLGYQDNFMCYDLDCTTYYKSLVFFTEYEQILKNNREMKEILELLYEQSKKISKPFDRAEFLLLSKAVLEIAEDIAGYDERELNKLHDGLENVFKIFGNAMWNYNMEDYMIDDEQVQPGTFVYRDFYYKRFFSMHDIKDAETEKIKNIIEKMPECGMKYVFECVNKSGNCMVEIKSGTLDDWYKNLSQICRKNIKTEIEYAVKCFTE